MALVICSIFLAITFTVISVIDEKMPALSGYAQSANTTLYNTVSASYNGLNLVTVLPILVIAAALIALTIGAIFAFQKSNFFSSDI